MNPMMLPFVMYQRWLEMIFVPFAKRTEATSNLVLKEVRAVQSAAIDRTKKVAYEG